MSEHTILDSSPEIVHRFVDHSCVDGPHTISIARSLVSDGFIAAVGPVKSGTVDLYRSPDCETWRPLADCPSYHRRGLRWPTVLTWDDCYYVAVRGWRPTGATTRFLDRITRTTVRHRPTYLAHRLIHSVTTPETSIQVLEVSASGDVRFAGTAVPPGDSGNQKNQNPFLFELPDGESVGLIYYSGDQEQSELRLKTASELTGLADATSHRLLQTSRTIAAPSCCVDPVSGDALVFAELMEDDIWKTIYYITDSLPTRISAEEYEELYTDNVACPFPFISNDDLYLGVAKKHEAGIIHRWTGEIHRFEA
jgi:hypothetical protein